MSSYQRRGRFRVLREYLKHSWEELSWAWFRRRLVSLIILRAIFLINPLDTVSVVFAAPWI